MSASEREALASYLATLPADAVERFRARMVKAAEAVRKTDDP